MAKTSPPPRQTMPGTAAVLQAVAKDKNGIGYGGAAYGAGASISRSRRPTVLPPSNPTEETVIKGTYPIWRYLYVYVNPELDKGDIGAYLKTGFAATRDRKLVKDVGYFPLPSHLREK